MGWAPIIDSQARPAQARRTDDDPSALEVALPDGTHLFVPRALVAIGADGTYHFEHSFESVMHATGSDDAVVLPVRDDAIVVPVVEEQLSIDKRTVVRGEVRLATTVSEREELVEVPLRQENVAVERVPVGTFVDAALPPWSEGATLIVPVYEEVLVVQKRLLLREQVRVTRTPHESTQRERVTLRREDVSIEPLPSESARDQ